jgi:hypothetical protein
MVNKELVSQESNETAPIFSMLWVIFGAFHE